jgi:hypothetical protein
MIDIPASLPGPAGATSIPRGGNEMNKPWTKTYGPGVPLGSTPKPTHPR